VAHFPPSGNIPNPAADVARNGRVEALVPQHLALNSKVRRLHQENVELRSELDAIGALRTRPDALEAT
jgi:hypothetical protein